VNGVFIFIGTVPLSDMIKDQVEVTRSGYIITDEKMATNIEGFFAAGDVRDKYLRQVITAASDGAIAAMAAEKYVHETELWENEVLRAQKPVIVVYYNPTDMEGTQKVGIADSFVRQYNDQFSLVKVDATRNELAERRYHIDLDQLPLVHVFSGGELKKTITEISRETLAGLLSH
jgi:thioredoxin reductase (NADPH)